MCFSVLSFLIENCANCDSRRVYFHFEGFGQLREQKHWFFGDCFFKRFKCFLFYLGPSPRYPSLCKVVKGSCELRKSFDEPPIEIEEAEESSRFSEICWCFPHLYSLCFYWIHSYFSVADDNSQIFHLQGFKRTLFWFEV